MWRLLASDIPALAVGAEVMGGGGGGSTVVGAILAEEALRATGPLPILEPEELDPDTWVAAVGIMGSVTVFEEKPAAGSEATRAVQALERHVGHSLQALLGFETAGLNALLPVASAASAGLPLLDLDAMGRAFPRVDQMLYTLHGLPLTPVVMVDDRGSLVVLDHIDAAQVERFARSVMVAMGGWSLLALGAGPVARLGPVLIRGSLQRALRLGRALHAGEVQRMVGAGGGRLRFSGRIVEVVRAEDGRDGAGSAVVQSVDEAGHLVRIEFQSENLLLLREGRVEAAVPEVISLLDHERSLPLSCEELRAGLEVDVVTFPAAPAWRGAAARALVGPPAFGFDVDDASAEGP